MSTNNYDAKIIMLPKPEAHPNADRLQIFNIRGFSVITDLSYHEGDVVVYFCLESQLNADLLHHLNLYASAAKNKDQSVKGFFDNSGRVRAVKLRTIHSEGYVLKLAVFNAALLDVFKIGGLAADIGFTFSTLSGVEIVKKYEPPVKGEAGTYGGNKRKVKSSVIVPGQFALHVDTPPAHRADWLRPGIPVIITEKLHGSNCAVGNALIKLPWWKRALNTIGFRFKDRKLIYASRNVIKNDGKESQHFYDSDIWAEALEPHLKMQDVWPDGLMLYGEIVGVSKTGSAVQEMGGKAYDYSKILRNGKKLGFFAFRAVFINKDGSTVEMCREYLEHICYVLSIPVVPLVERTVVGQDVDAWIKEIKSKYATGFCNLCNNEVLREGVVANYDNSYVPASGLDVNKFNAAKIKSAAFLGKETEELDGGNDIQS